MDRKSKYTEIFRLKEMLEEHNIKFKFYDSSIEDDVSKSLNKDLVFEHYQIACPDRNIPEQYLSVIQGTGTYGQQKDLLEIMGLSEPNEDGDGGVVGYLTAEEVFSRIQKYWITNWRFIKKEKK